MINAEILPFVQAMDAFFPIGAYTLSDGMETYVYENIVKDEKTLEKFLSAYLHILQYTKLGFAAKSAIGIDYKMLDELCSASTSAYEVRSGSKKLCVRFLKAQKAIGEYLLLEEYSKAIKNDVCEGCFPIAIGLFIKELKIDVVDALILYTYNQLSAMVNHAVKLIPLPQLAGQKALSAILKDIPNAVETALDCDIEELGVSGNGFEMRSIQHEILPSRMYIS